MIFGEKSSQDRSGERLRMATAKKNDKNRFRRRLRTHFFSPGAVFSGFGAPGRDSKIAKKPTLAPITRLLFVPATRFFTFSSLGRVPEGSRTDSGGSGVPPGPDFAKILRYFFAGFAGILSWFVGFRRNVAGIHRQPPELTLRGFSGVRRSRGAN